MNISEKGIHFIIKEEGENLTAYKCQAGIWTIGVGHTGKEVKEGMTITKEQSSDLLKQDLKRFEQCVHSNCHITLKNHEFDALVSLAFNIGCEAFKKSTLLRKINNKSSIEEIEKEFNKWIYGNGRVLPVLVGRRKREFKLFKDGVYD